MDSRRRLGLIVALAATSAHADPVAIPPNEPPPKEPSDRDRMWTTVRIAAEGITYLTLEFGLNSELSPTHCRWCTPDAFDGAMADALAWRDTSLANTLGDVSGYVLSPILMSAGLVAAGWGHGTRRAFDDVAPIVEAAIVASLAQHLFKLTVARARPYAFHAASGTLEPNVENDVSFWSGHSSLTFSLAVAAGSVADLRGYALAPAIWATGLSLAAVTGYLRVAADKHWTTDVMAGAAIGSILGYIWPRYIHRWIHKDVTITPNGVSLTGSF
ncbi:MAG TPA: phosphatase PAP2 family protein [Kofleriaceae bacterium]